MFILRSFSATLCTLYIILNYVRSAAIEAPFGCLGGSVYFSAHPVDVLLFMNPDIYHDLYVYKCVTTVIFTSGDRGAGSDIANMLEQGLGEAFSTMAGSPMYKDSPVGNSTKLQLGDYSIDVWSPRWTKRVHNVYLRLPDSGLAGQGFIHYDRESLRKLLDGAIDTITTVDGNATYTLQSLQDLIGAILDARRPNQIKTFSHKAEFPVNENDVDAEQADHIVSAQLVVNAVKDKQIAVDIQQYAGNVDRAMEANMNTTRRDYYAKAQAFFQYAAYDNQMCQTLEDCEARAASKEIQEFIDNDLKYAGSYLSREFYAS